MYICRPRRSRTNTNTYNTHIIMSLSELLERVRVLHTNVMLQTLRFRCRGLRRTEATGCDSLVRAGPFIKTTDNSTNLMGVCEDYAILYVYVYFPCRDRPTHCEGGQKLRVDQATGGHEATESVLWAGVDKDRC